MLGETQNFFTKRVFNVTKFLMSTRLHLFRALWCRKPVLSCVSPSSEEFHQRWTLKSAFLPPNPTPRSVPVLSPETAGHSSLKPAGRSSARPPNLLSWSSCLSYHAWAPLCLRWSHSSLLRLCWSRPTLLRLLRLRWSQPALLLQSSLRNPSWPVGPFPPRKAEQPGQGHEGPCSMASWMASSSTASWTPCSTLEATLIPVPVPVLSTCPRSPVEQLRCGMRLPRGGSIVRVMFGFCPSFHCVFSWPVPLWPSFP